jgi:hypothetical protein
VTDDKDDKDDAGREETSEAVEDEDALVDDYVEEIEELLADFPALHDEMVDTALFTCAVHRAVDAEIPKEEFLEMMGRMYEESREMDDLQSRMSLTRGDA